MMQLSCDHAFVATTNRMRLLVRIGPGSRTRSVLKGWFTGAGSCAAGAWLRASWRGYRRAGEATRA